MSDTITPQALTPSQIQEKIAYTLVNAQMRYAAKVNDELAKEAKSTSELTKAISHLKNTTETLGLVLSLLQGLSQVPSAPQKPVETSPT